MLEVEFIEIFIRAMPEQVLLVMGSYILSKTKLNEKRILISGVVMGVAYMLLDYFQYNLVFIHYLEYVY